MRYVPTDTMTSDTPQAAVTVIHQLMSQYSLDPAIMLEGNDSGVSFTSVLWYSVLTVNLGQDIGVVSSKVTYAAVAPFVGLDPHGSLGDINTFEIHRSRIPTLLFKSIMMDIDNMLMEFGPPYDHLTEEATSRFFSPVRNNLILSHPQKFTTTIRFLTT